MRLNYLFKLIVEGLINSCKIFDNAVANVVVAAISLFIAFFPAWDITDFLYDLGIIKTKNEGSLIHWIVRGVVAVLFILIVKIIWEIILFIHNNFMKIVLILFTGIMVCFFIFQCEKKYKNRKKSN